MSALRMIKLFRVYIVGEGVMKTWFSPTLVSFYPEALRASYVAAGSLPDDLVEVSEECFAIYSGTPPEGKQRGVGEDSLPCWVDIPVVEITDDQLKSQARGYRDAFINATDKMLLPDYTILDQPLSGEQSTELATVRETFKKWPSQEGWPQIELPEIPQWLLVEAVNNGYVVYNWPINAATPTN